MAKDKENKIAQYNEIFLKNILQIRLCSDAVYYCRVQDIRRIEDGLCDIIILKTKEIFEKAMENLEFYNADYDILNTKELSFMIADLKETIDNQDYVYFADILELQIIPILVNMQSILRNVVTIYGDDNNYFKHNINLLEKRDPQLAQKIKDYNFNNQELYVLEYTNIGTITLSIKECNEIYGIHTINNPFEDGRVFAKRYYTPDIKNYVIYGFGLGYHVMMLSKESSNAKIEVYESNLDILYLAFSYMDLSEVLENPKINLCYDSNFSLFGEQLNTTALNMQEKRVIIFYPSIRTIPFPTIKVLMENVICQENIQEQAYALLKDNFNHNSKHYDDVVDKLEQNFHGKDVYIVAAGPSLDKNVNMLKNINNDSSIILATGTVYKKLLAQDITPDYVIVLDPNETVYKQISGVEASTVPMIFLSTAYKGFSKNYKGYKYIVLQEEFGLSEELAEKLGTKVYKTGGSVSTIALEVSIRLGAKRVVFLGLDLAYTDNFGHASGTSQRGKKEHSEYIRVKSVDGGTVLSSKVFCEFRHWIEERIKREKSCEFIDATEGGAYIEGTKIMHMEELL
ncbi:motility associated factor glycosyltransferase family protein [Anaerosacchariphilus polymeriproducens]|nr:6-hydroxymethylpterin diphosphokinase MptE-like protein [Anaerosacchariphilus polymeriproducens]